ncbi:MAG: hypothetical protein ED559_05905 [Phycisphaera sp.]|nr:MAG: hypothetical protein ED559_05905 [Phycisphaera sp.]
MNTYQKLTAAAIATVCTASSAQVVLNEDLTGPVGAGNTPPDWFAWSGSADTCDASGPFNNSGNPWVLSPNGGTFVRGGSTGTGVNEAIAQNLIGFTAGQSYTVEFWHTNLGFQQPGGSWTGADGFWRFYADGTAFGDAVTLSKQTLADDDIVWTFGSLSFVAPADDFELAIASQFAGGPGTAAYMGIDGVRIRPIPAPASLSLLAASGLCASRRRR